MLYRLVEVLEAPIVFIVEGEKDVETLRSHGFVATTNAGGANLDGCRNTRQHFAGENNPYFSSDGAGRQRVIRIARALQGNVPRSSFLNSTTPRT